MEKRIEATDRFLKDDKLLEAVNELAGFFDDLATFGNRRRYLALIDLDKLFKRLIRKMHSRVLTTEEMTNSLHLGLALIGHEYYIEAMRILRILRSLAYDQEILYVALAKGAFMIGEFDESREYYSLLHERFPHNKIASERLSVLNTIPEKELIASLERRIATNLRSVNLRQSLAESYLRINDFDHAIEQFEILLRQHPDKVFLYHVFAGVYFKARRLSEAIAVYDRGIRALPGAVGLYFRKAQLESFSGNFDSATETLRTLETIMPNHPDVFAAYGDMYYLKRDFVKGEEAFLNSLRQKRDQPSTLLKLAKNYYEMRRWVDALDCLKYADNYDMEARERFAVQLMRANIFRKSAQFDESLEQCSRLLARPNLSADEISNVQTCEGFCFLEKYKIDHLEEDFLHGEKSLCASAPISATACCGVVFLYCERVFFEPWQRSTLEPIAHQYILQAEELDPEAKDLPPARLRYKQVF
jgi:tetratricopeptide (TPR) repeat protein